MCLCSSDRIKCASLVICVCVMPPGAPPSCVNSHQSMKAALRFHSGLRCNGLETPTIHTPCGQVNNLHGQHLYAWAAIRDVQIQIDQGHRCKWLTSCCCLSSPSSDVLSDNSNSVSVSYTLVFAFELFCLLISIICPQRISWQCYSPQNVGTN